MLRARGDECAMCVLRGEPQFRCFSRDGESAKAFGRGLDSVAATRDSSSNSTWADFAWQKSNSY